jgi:hypothetical protein
MISFSRSRILRISRAWMSISVACPWKLALGPRREEERPHAGRLSEADRVDRRLDVLHGVVDAQSGRHAAAGRVDIEVDVLFGILGLEKQQLGDDEVREDIVDRGPQENDAVFEQARVDVVGALPPVRLLDDDRH